MTDGSPEANDPQADLDPSAADAALEQFMAEEDLGTLEESVGEAVATEVTETEVAEASVPEDEAEGSGPVPASDAEPTGDAVAEEPSDPDLTHLPDYLREALRGQPIEVQQAQDKAFRKFQSGYNRDKTELKEQQDTFIAEQTKDAELRRFGAAFQEILGNDETADEALALARRTRAFDGQGAEAEDPFDGIMDAEDDDAMRERIKAGVRQEVVSQLEERAKPDQQKHAMKAAVATSAQAVGITGEHKDLFWATVDALDAEAEANGWEITPENVDGFLRPRLELALAKAPRPAETTQPAKPAAVKGRKAASVTRDSTATTQHKFNAERIAAENRHLESEDIEDLMEDVANETGMTHDELHKVIRGATG